jgi:hypothetical protein
MQVTMDNRLLVRRARRTDDEYEMVSTHGVRTPESTSAAAWSEAMARSKRLAASAGVGPSSTSDARRQSGAIVGWPVTSSSTALCASSGWRDAMADDAADAIWLAPEFRSEAAR